MKAKCLRNYVAITFVFTSLHDYGNVNSYISHNTNLRRKSKWSSVCSCAHPPFGKASCCLVTTGSVQYLLCWNIVATAMTSFNTQTHKPSHRIKHFRWITFIAIVDMHWNECTKIVRKKWVHHNYCAALTNTVRFLFPQLDNRKLAHRLEWPGEWLEHTIMSCNALPNLSR